MEYIVIEAGTASSLTQKVNEKIKDGWKPIGSHQVVTARSINRFSGLQHKDTINEVDYTQTMIKDE